MSTPIPEERRQAILEQVRTRSLVKAAELSRDLGVSVESIRRDLLALEQEGHVRRVYGGATRAEARAFEPAFERRRIQHRDRKTAMGRLAAGLVEPGDTLILDVGTSVAEVARELPRDYRGKVLTNSLLVASTLAGREGVEVYTSGGRVRAGDLACFGPTSEGFFRDYFADKAFLGSGGVHHEMGLTDYWPDEIASRRIILEHAAKRFVMADSSKLGRVALGKVCDLTVVTAVITDDRASAADLHLLEESGVTVMVAAVEGGHATAGNRAKGVRSEKV
jgi:DeoR family transcriptional regulator, fructose operon transcriptional repressor